MEENGKMGGQTEVKKKMGGGKNGMRVKEKWTKGKEKWKTKGKNRGREISESKGEEKKRRNNQNKSGEKKEDLKKKRRGNMGRQT